MIVKVILSAAVAVFLLAVVASMVMMCIEDTETFRAIDEKVARFIKGEDEEQVYSNGTEYVPMFLMRQWFEHIAHKRQEPCEDTISRQAALDALGEAPEVWADSPEEFAALSQWEMDVTAIEAVPSAEPKIDDENELKFYYVESLDDYWVGRRLDNFYYANWHEGLGFVWSHSRYLPWGEHIVDENTLWKEHTYPSEPIEIPFTEWIVGFVKKYFAEPKTGRCETCKRNADNGGFYDDGRTRCPIQEHYVLLKDGYCHLYEPRMRGEEE